MDRVVCLIERRFVADLLSRGDWLPTVHDARRVCFDIVLDDSLRIAVCDSVCFFRTASRDVAVEPSFAHAANILLGSSRFGVWCRGGAAGDQSMGC